MGYHLLCFLPSTVAAASVTLALAWEGDAAGVAQLPPISGYTVGALRGCMGALLALYHAGFHARDLQDPFLPIKDKYCEASRHCVAALPPLPLLPAWLFKSSH